MRLHQGQHDLDRMLSMPDDQIDEQTRSAINHILTLLDEDPESHEPFEGAEFTFTPEPQGSGSLPLLTPEILVCGKYLGSGGRGWVYECNVPTSADSGGETPTFSGRRAIKIARDDCDLRLSREAEFHSNICQRLNPNDSPSVALPIPRFGAIGKVELKDCPQSRTAILMEVVDGLTLEQATRKTNASEARTPEANIGRCLRVAAAILDGLSVIDHAYSELHGGRGEHSDLKPSNIMVTDFETSRLPKVTIIDLGAWRDSWEEAHEGTPSNPSAGPKADQVQVAKILQGLLDPYVKTYGEDHKSIKEARAVVAKLRDRYYTSPEDAAKQIKAVANEVDRSISFYVTLIRKHALVVAKWAALIAIGILFFHEIPYGCEANKASDELANYISEHAKLEQPKGTEVDASVPQADELKNAIDRARNEFRSGWVLGPAWSNEYLPDFFGYQSVAELDQLERECRLLAGLESENQISDVIELLNKGLPSEIPSPLWSKIEARLTKGINLWLERSCETEMGRPDAVLIQARTACLARLKTVKIVAVPESATLQLNQIDALKSAEQRISDVKVPFDSPKDRPSLAEFVKTCLSVKLSLPAKQGNWAEPWRNKVDEDFKSLIDLYLEPLSKRVGGTELELRQRFGSNGQVWGEWLSQLKQDLLFACEKNLISSPRFNSLSVEIKRAEAAAWHEQLRLWWNEMSRTWGGWCRPGAEKSGLTMGQFLKLADDWLAHAENESEARRKAITKAKRVATGTLVLMVNKSAGDTASVPLSKFVFVDANENPLGTSLFSPTSAMSVAIPWVGAANGGPELRIHPQWHSGTQDIAWGLDQPLTNFNDRLHISPLIITQSALVISQEYLVPLKLDRKMLIQLFVSIELPPITAGETTADYFADAE